MIFQNYPLYYIFFISAFICGFITYFSWKRRDVRSALPFSILMGLITWWLFFYGCEVITAVPNLHLFFTAIEYLAIPWIPAILILFSLEFGGYQYCINKRNLLILFFPSSLIFLLFFTNQYHHLFYSQLSFYSIDGLTGLIIEPGIFYWILYALDISSAIFCMIVVCRTLLHSPEIFRPQLIISVISVIGILSGLIWYLLGMRLYPDFNILPVILVFVGVILLINIFRFQYFDLIHIPYHTIFKHLNEGIIVLDNHNRIIQVNEKAADLLKIVPETVLGKSVNTIESPLSSYFEELTAYEHSTFRIESGAESRDLSLVIDMYPVLNSSSLLETRMIIIRDISDIVSTSKALSEAGKKLKLLNSVTRHDILNQVTILSGYLSLITDCINEDERCHTHIERIHDASNSIKELIQFTAMYQDLGISKPVWNNIQIISFRAWKMVHPPDSVRLLVQTDLIVFADMLLEKVFFNLMDNSFRHGSHVSSIRISSSRDENWYFLYYEDNGTGIEPELKEMIFKRGFGKNTGYGMFLVREILSITSISIREIGEYGSGVRFEMKIPLHGGHYSDENPH